MALSLNDALKNPVTYLYMFADDDFLSYLEPSRAKVILAKRENAKKIINGEAMDNGSTFTAWAQAIYDKIVNIYGYSPYEMLKRLALGQTIAGKNWSKGIYGIGEVTSEVFNQDGTIVNPTTGGIQTTQPVVNITGIRDEQGNLVGFSSTTQNGTQYQTVKDSTGTYKAYSFSNASTQQYANGQTYDQTKAAQVWQNVLTYLPQVTDAIISIVQAANKTPITAANTSPAQSDWESTGADNTTGLLVLAGGAAALVALSSKK